jgi:hypothetical protein
MNQPERQAIKEAQINLMFGPPGVPLVCLSFVALVYLMCV